MIMRIATAKSRRRHWDEALASFLSWEWQDCHESVEAIRRSYEDVKAGRTRTATEFLQELREKHDFPR